jgi:hypothetical protein
MNEAHFFEFHAALPELCAKKDFLRFERGFPSIHGTAPDSPLAVAAHMFDTVIVGAGFRRDGDMQAGRSGKFF